MSINAGAIILLLILMVTATSSSSTSAKVAENNEENFDKSYIDTTDPANPTEVHVRRLSKLDPNGASFISEHTETRRTSNPGSQSMSSSSSMVQTKIGREETNTFSPATGSGMPSQTNEFGALSSMLASIGGDQMMGFPPVSPMFPPSGPFFWFPGPNNIWPQQSQFQQQVPSQQHFPQQASPATATATIKPE